MNEGNASRRMRVLELLETGGWFTTIEINAVGGTEGTRRLRELRGMGYNIEKRRTEGRQFEYKLKDLHEV
jgi:predicted DNA-binding ArsR family transcriptional regulator